MATRTVTLWNHCNCQRHHRNQPFTGRGRTTVDTPSAGHSDDEQRPIFVGTTTHGRHPHGRRGTVPGVGPGGLGTPTKVFGRLKRVPSRLPLGVTPGRHARPTSAQTAPTFGTLTRSTSKGGHEGGIFSETLFAAVPLGTVDRR